MPKKKQKTIGKKELSLTLQDKIAAYRSENIKEMPQKTRRQVNGTDYEKKYTKCPNCRMTGNRVTNVLPKEDGIVIRYHNCQRCGNSFKSVDVFE
jgi:hypothetical protein